MAQNKKAPGGLENAGLQHDYKLVDVADLKPYAKNAKIHPPWQVNQLKESIRQFGFITPIVVDEHYTIVAGHGRLEAAKLLGYKRVPVIMITHLSEAQLRAYRLADNKLTMNTGFDTDILRVELQELDGLDLDFNLEITGFTTGDLDIIIGSDDPEEDEEADIIPETLDDPLTQPGDLWLLGDHRLLCGNALEGPDYRCVMGEDKADAVFTDPPYNVPVNGHVCGNGKVKHAEFAMASGEMSDAEFRAFLSGFMALAVEHSSNGSLHYLCMDWRGIQSLLDAGEPHYAELKNICVWNKDNGGMGSLYRSKHELVAVFKNGTAAHINNVQLGKHGRYRTNVWDYRGVNSFAGKEDLKLHPTVKPVALVADAVMDSTERGGIVLDPFAGSGSTLIACEMTGRKARCIEIEPRYCDVIIRRWQVFTGQDARHALTGKTFNETAQIQGEQNHE